MIYYLLVEVVCGMIKIGVVINYTNFINNISLKKTFLTQSKNFLEGNQFFEDENDVIYSKLENMKEKIKLINISYPYGDKFVDLIINKIYQKIWGNNNK